MHLILQSAQANINRAMIETLKDLTQASNITELSHYGFRLNEVRLTDSVRQRIKTQCELATIDCNVLDRINPLNHYQLLAMDMDSTLITIECIDEIASFCGKKDEVAQITEAAMRGEITDYDESLRRRVAILAGLDAQVLQQVFDERLRLSPGAETLIAHVKKAGLKTLLVSGGFNFFTEKLKHMLGLDYAYANQLEIIDGKLTGKVLGDIINGQAKARLLHETCQSLGCTTAHAIALGDGANDLPMLNLAGIGVAYHAKPIVREQARFAITHCPLDGVLSFFE